MNEDDIQIQPSAMPPEPDDADAGGAVPTGPAARPAGSDIRQQTYREPIEMSPSESSEEQGDSPPEKVVDITDDFNITPAKDEPMPAEVPSILAQLTKMPSANSVGPEPKLSTAPKINTAATPAANAPAPAKSLANNQPVMTPEERAAENARRMGIDQILHKLNLPTQSGQKSSKPVVPGRLPPTGPQKAIRTYEGDVAEVLAHRKSSTASIAIAENRKNTGEERLGAAAEGPAAGEGSGAGKKIIITLASLLLIGGGAVGAYYLYSLSPLAPAPRVVEQPQAAPSLVPSDTQVAIPIDNMDPAAVIKAVRAEMAKTQATNTVKEVILVQTKNGQHFRVSGPDAVNAMDIGMPDILVRALADGWMLGVYADANGDRTVFVVATVDYFQNAFAGMLQWESLMADDLKQYLYQNTPSDVTTAASASAMATTAAVTGVLTDSLANMGNILPTASSTASATPPAASTTATLMQMAQPYVVLRGSFVDRIIRNKDVREFVTSNGNVLFLYSFIDNTKLVVTGSEAALAEIVNRLEQQAFVR